jgi:hypothetical protein
LLGASRYEKTKLILLASTAISSASGRWSALTISRQCRLVDSRHIELWSGDRFLVRLEHKPEKAACLAACLILKRHCRLVLPRSFTLIGTACDTARYSVARFLFGAFAASSGLN